MDEYNKYTLNEFKSKVLKINNYSNEENIKKFVLLIEKIVEHISVYLPTKMVDSEFNELEITKNYLIETKDDIDNTKMIVLKKTIIDILDSLLNIENTPKNDNLFDVFISHASADKVSYVKALYNEISKLGLKVFYDSDSIEWGDKWKERILDATSRSRLAIIVISKNFFGRKWTEKELSEFMHRQNKTKQKIVLPIIYGVTSEEINTQYPFLEDIQYIDAKNYSKKDIALLFANQYIKHQNASN